MAQIDPAPPAELVDPVSASPLEPFANPDAARNEPGMEPKIKIDGEHSTMAADGLLDPAAACIKPSCSNPSGCNYTTGVARH